MLDKELIAFLRMTPAERKAAVAANKPRTGPGTAYVKTPEGLKAVSLDSVDIGGFVGKAGSIRRSRKGQPRRLANGRRVYQEPWNNPVVSYKPEPLVR